MLRLGGSLRTIEASGLVPDLCQLGVDAQQYNMQHPSLTRNAGDCAVLLLCASQEQRHLGNGTVVQTNRFAVASGVLHYRNDRGRACL